MESHKNDDNFNEIVESLTFEINCYLIEESSKFYQAYHKTKNKEFLHKGSILEETRKFIRDKYRKGA